MKDVRNRVNGGLGSGWQIPNSWKRGDKEEKIFIFTKFLFLSFYIFELIQFCCLKLCKRFHPGACRDQII